MRIWGVIVSVAVLFIPVADAAPPTVPPPPFVDPLRGPTALDQATKPPLMAPTENKDVIRGRAFAQQPPTIPHKIDGYQLDRNANVCLACHARSRAAQSGATPIGISHYSNRAGETLGHLAPRRYFCTACHVPQADTQPLVGNTFMELNDVKMPSGARAKRP
ncbi:nitrate reductase cytochrome c-type subunit [Paraburkholderia adhaesiva]|uniref:nitrate reductase cytochrome c-type subunit n=1 Tax=Paraburkholderia adhaesiva TaxID=2883244 RepID=UPI001F46D81B|nr:nitrate reductase cytochrome c-type subunit [Paraburkholderia adhaesiva]